MAKNRLTPWNPSKRAINRVKEPLPKPTECPFCRDPQTGEPYPGSVEIAHHMDIYGKVYGDWPWVYRCQYCDARTGMHPYTDIPLGTLADQKTRIARTQCKKHFEKLWRYNDSPLTRKQAYRWLADQMGIPVSECHFGWFSAERCYRARDICKRFTPDDVPRGT